MERPDSLEILLKVYIGKEELHHEVDCPLQGGQSQVGVPQVPLLGHGTAVEA